MGLSLTGCTRRSFYSEKGIVDFGLRGWFVMETFLVGEKVQSEREDVQVIRARRPRYPHWRLKEDSSKGCAGGLPELEGSYGCQGRG